MAQGVTSWLQFELSCKRGELLSEASLSQPLGQLLKATGSRAISPQEPHPRLSNAWVDFVEKVKGGRIRLAIETKWINGKREMKQELLDDLIRLELIHTTNQTTDRWLLIAGEYGHLESKVFNASLNVGGGGGRVLFSTGLLPLVTGVSFTIDVDNSGAPMRALWKKTPVVMPLAPKWPSGMKTTLLVQFPLAPKPTDVACFIWHVARMQNRSTTTLP